MSTALQLLILRASRRPCGGRGRAVVVVAFWRGAMCVESLRLCERCAEEAKREAEDAKMRTTTHPVG